VDSLLRKVKQASDDESDDYDDASNTSLDASDDGDDGDDDDDDSEDMDKAYHEHAGGNSPHRMRGQHVKVNRPDTYRISATPPPEGPGKRHKFEARVDYIKDRDGISRTQAMSRARTEFPTTYVSYQRHLASRTTRQQHMVRGWDKVGKSSASTTYEDLVSDQIAKGCSYELAQQRVAQAHGFRALDTRIMKSSNLADRFQRIVKRIADEDCCSLEEATRQARYENPTLFKALQVV